MADDDAVGLFACVPMEIASLAALEFVRTDSFAARTMMQAFVGTQSAALKFPWSSAPGTTG
jgi:hypothetical protein